MHFVKGKPKGSGKRRSPAQAVTYPPGHFTRGITSATFLVGWTPSTGSKANPGSVIGGLVASEKQTAFGGRITMDLPRTPSGNRKPGRMAKA